MDIMLGLPKTLSKHTIGLVPKVSILNLSHYRVNLIDLKLFSTKVAYNTCL